MFSLGLRTSVEVSFEICPRTAVVVCGLPHRCWALVPQPDRDPQNWQAWSWWWMDQKFLLECDSHGNTGWNMFGTPIFYIHQIIKLFSAMHAHMNCHALASLTLPPSGTLPWSQRCDCSFGRVQKHPAQKLQSPKADPGWRAKRITILHPVHSFGSLLEWRPQKFLVVAPKRAKWGLELLEWVQEQMGPFLFSFFISSKIKLHR
jgi:hypothetical protein